MVRSRSKIQWSILDDGMLDQMGVELGKVLAKAILAQLETPNDVKGHDSSVSTRSSLICGDKLTFFGGVDHGFDSLLPETQERVNSYEV